MMSWFDIGVNLTNERLDIEPVVARAKDAGVVGMMLTGTSVSESHKALRVCLQYPNFLYSTAGVHPHYAVDVETDYLKQLRQIANNQQVVAIGECGLDFNRNFSPKQQQLDVFESQLSLAATLKKPVFLHERDAFAEQFELLSYYQSKLVGGVAHCFTGNVKQMESYLSLGLYIGVTGWLCDKVRGENLRQAVCQLPIERLLLETDAPYLRPKGLANNRKIDKGNNEPAYLPFIGQQVAELKRIDLALVQQHSLVNSQTLFGF